MPETYQSALSEGLKNLNAQQETSNKEVLKEITNNVRSIEMGLTHLKDPQKKEQFQQSYNSLKTQLDDLRKNIDGLDNFSKAVSDLRREVLAAYESPFDKHQETVISTDTSTAEKKVTDEATAPDDAQSNSEVTPVKPPERQYDDINDYGKEQYELYQKTQISSDEDIMNVAKARFEQMKQGLNEKQRVLVKQYVDDLDFGQRETTPDIVNSRSRVLSIMGVSEALWRTMAKEQQGVRPDYNASAKHVLDYLNTKIKPELEKLFPKDQYELYLSAERPVKAYRLTNNPNEEAAKIVVFARYKDEYAKPASAPSAPSPQAEKPVKADSVAAPTPAPAAKAEANVPPAAPDMPEATVTQAPEAPATTPPVTPATIVENTETPTPTLQQVPELFPTNNTDLISNHKNFVSFVEQALTKNYPKEVKQDLAAKALVTDAYLKLKEATYTSPEAMSGLQKFVDEQSFFIWGPKAKVESAIKKLQQMKANLPNTVMFESFLRSNL